MARANQKPAFRRRWFFWVKNDGKGIKIVGEGLDIRYLASNVVAHQNEAASPQRFLVLSKYTVVRHVVIKRVEMLVKGSLKH